MSDRLKIALVQPSLLWEDPQSNLRRLEDFIQDVQETDLIILPEMFSTGFTMQPAKVNSADLSKTLSWMDKMAQKHQCAITGSTIVCEDGRYFNRLYFVNHEGNRWLYDKRHTFTLAGEDKVYTKGRNRTIIPYKGFRICPMICYDLRFPVWSRNSEDFDVLLYVANWPSARVDAWDTLLRARAIENMVYCIGVNRIGSDDNGLEYPGHSAVYDSLGNSLVFSEKEEIIYAELHKEHLNSTREKLKFLQDRDSFSLLP
ncbi:MAG: amidohydrolase [Flavobacteriaceae bacterium]